jgi:hypothetical protein
MQLSRLYLVIPIGQRLFRCHKRPFLAKCKPIHKSTPTKDAINARAKSEQGLHAEGKAIIILALF